MCVNCDVSDGEGGILDIDWQPTHVRELRRQKRTEIVIHLL